MMCKDDSDILLLSFNNHCPCPACPDKILHAMKRFEGVRKATLNYEKGTAELIVQAEVAENPSKLCEWIHKKTKKRMSIIKTIDASFHTHKDSEDSDNEEIEEEIICRELREVVVRRIKH